MEKGEKVIGRFLLLPGSACVVQRPPDGVAADRERPAAHAALERLLLGAPSYRRGSVTECLCSPSMPLCCSFVHY